MNYDINKLKGPLADALKSIEPASKKDTVLILGRTGSGKSTTINYLLGYPFKRDDDGDDYVAIPKNADSRLPATLSNKIRVKNNYPTTFNAADFNDMTDINLVYCDCPQFTSTVDSEVNICSMIALEAAIERAQSIKGIVLIIDLPSLLAEHGRLIAELLKTLSKLITLNDDLDLSKSLLVLFTKANERSSKLPLKKLKALLDRTKLHLEDDKSALIKILNSASADNLSDSNRQHASNLKEEIASKEKVIKLLGILLDNADSCIVPNVFDDGESRDNIVKAISILQAIPKEQFNFIGTVGQRNEFLNTLRQQMIDFISLTTQLKELPKQIKDMKSLHWITIKPQYEKLSRVREEALAYEHGLGELRFRSKYKAEKEYRWRIERETEEEVKACSKRHKEKLAPLSTKLESLKNQYQNLKESKENIALLKNTYNLSIYLKLPDQFPKITKDFSQSVTVFFEEVEKDLLDNSAKPNPKQTVVEHEISIDQEHLQIDMNALLGSGSYGQVYKGQYQGMAVAVKQLYDVGVIDNRLQDFQTEVTINYKVRHENCVRFYGACFTPPYSIVMELMTGGSLYDLLRSSKELPWEKRYSIAKDVAHGLVHLHSQNIIHRDIKSLNVMLSDTLRAKLTDFGLGKLKQDTHRASRLSSSNPAAASANIQPKAVGTTAWNAPELLKGRKPQHTKASDMYSFGMVLWELASRNIPFQDALSEQQIYDWVKSDEKEEIPADTPASFSKLISSLWASPDVRPTADEAAKILSDCSQEKNSFKPLMSN